MAYIGRQPTVGNFQICDAISVVNGQAAYTMQVGSVNVIPQSANHMICSLNGTIQKPNSSFTVSGSTITFASNLATGDVIDFIQILGDVLDLGTPSDATVSLAKLTATGTKDATTFLRGDNTFASAGLSNWSESSGNLLPSNASYGIYLGVNSATAANLLDDYEEGTWTPAIVNGGSPSYSTQTGVYTKIGRLVICTFSLNYSGASNGNNTRLSGLPFTSFDNDMSRIGNYGTYAGTGDTDRNSLMAFSTSVSSTALDALVIRNNSSFNGGGQIILMT